MRVRASTINDNHRIRAIHQSAFGETEGESIAQLAVNLLQDPTALPILSLVAEEGDALVGSVIFSAVNIEGATKAVTASIMAPVAVTPPVQRRGIGTQLIENGLQQLKARGTDIVLVLGDPGYYSRTGFSAGHGLKPPYELDNPDAWMAQALTPGALDELEGTVRCADTLSAPEHW